MRRDTWKPKQMVGMALKTAVQEEELWQKQPLGGSSREEVNAAKVWKRKQAQLTW